MKLPDGMELSLPFVASLTTLGAVRAFMEAVEALPDSHEIGIAPTAPDSYTDALYVTVGEVSTDGPA